MFLAAHHPAPGFELRDALAILVMAIAIAGEGIADCISDETGLC